MNGLLLHCGGQLKSREEVFAVPTPPATAMCPFVTMVVSRNSQLIQPVLKRGFFFTPVWVEVSALPECDLK
jgi:hypothetical protein